MIYFLVLILNVFFFARSISHYSKKEISIQLKKATSDEVRKIIGECEDVFESELFKFLQILISKEENKIKEERDEYRYYYGILSAAIAFILSRAQLKLDIKTAALLIAISIILFICIYYVSQLIKEMVRPHLKKWKRVYYYIIYNIK